MLEVANLGPFVSRNSNSEMRVCQGVVGNQACLTSAEELLFTQRESILAVD